MASGKGCAMVVAIPVGMRARPSSVRTGNKMSDEVDATHAFHDAGKSRAVLSPELRGEDAPALMLRGGRSIHWRV